MWERLREWFSERKQKLDLFDETNVERYDNPLYLLGQIVYFSWIVVVVSGILLMIWYEPTTHGAYNSILRIQHEIPLGWLIRGMHKYGADMLIIAITLRIYRMYFLGEYKRPNELSWMILFASLVLAMISGLTGYLLIWNQRAFWAAKVVLTVAVYLDQLPLIGQTRFGSAIAFAFLGGPAEGQGTLTRFYAIHFGISVLLLILVELYFIFTRRKRFNLSPTALVILLVMLVATSWIFPAEMGRRADPNRTPLPILSDWYFLALYQYVKYTPPLWAGLGPGLLIAYGMLVPFLDRSKGRRPSERPFFTVVGAMALTYFLVFTALILFNIAVIGRDPHIVLILTALTLSLGFVLELRYRRKVRAAEAAAPRTAPRAVAVGPAPSSGG
ncbi:MAG: cytochrome b N-terminal domain-containing protein [Armatimonadota bacterium]|nr:cytochrome b N-terminal domain-containing protein [Armatimonadota bacterium]MDR7439048.1 cytochrome b N-terminal domain-containing protein [Armatimonadota bacterium]MDR7563015.1 cytochrome b N-terminal domain-containing protein [Armatimonadota bacterium]MDR7567666.1 cytochrome b N-terminal domain-containing protein [Armatimonadota bacterium]MDR7600859.1 cytochrome b N-terminal domain-containing protein [Armatimonadota bacterium]